MLSERLFSPCHSCTEKTASAFLLLTLTAEVKLLSLPAVASLALCAAVVRVRGASSDVGIERAGTGFVSLTEEVIQKGKTETSIFNINGNFYLFS